MFFGCWKVWHNVFAHNPLDANISMLLSHMKLAWILMLTGALHTDWSQFLNHNANWQQVTYTRMPNELSVSKQKLVAGSRIIIWMHSTNLEIRFNTSKRHHIPDCYNDQLHMEPRSDSSNLKQSSLNRSKYKPIFYTELQTEIWELKFLSISACLHNQYTVHSS